MEQVRLTLPSKPQYVQTLRLVTASVANSLHFNIEEVDDLRVCVSEAVNYLLPYNKKIDVVFELDCEELTIHILAASSFPNDDDGLHHMILESLLDSVDENEDEIVLVKKHRAE